MNHVAVAHDSAPAASQRDALSRLRSLLVLSQLMMESTSERQLVQLAVGAARSLAPCDDAWISLDRSTGLPTGAGDGAGADTDARGDHHGLRAEEREDGTLAYPLRAAQGHLGWLVVSCRTQPSEEQRFLLRALAQQTGAAVANRRLHEQERHAAAEAAAANSRLQETLDALQHSLQVHARLTQAAASGEGREGIARAVHEVTGYPVAIEDRYGNLRAWAGPNRPDPYPKDPAARRELLLRRALRAGRPIREGGRLIAVTQPQQDVLGVLVLVDPARSAGKRQLMALEHGMTVLAMELARLRSLAESELRVRRDLVEELLAGTDDDSALRRAQALGYDLERPHRVVVIEGRGQERDEEAFLHAVRRAARDEPVGTLLVRRGRQVVVLADAEADWEHFRRSILHELGGGRCRLGVGDRCATIADFPQSLHQAEVALRVQAAASWGDRATCYVDLGVYQLLAEIQDPGAAERFARRWLKDLLAYDEKRNADLVLTLGRYLECGGNYDDTSAALFIHRSTLKYRLQRIREITGYDLKDPDTRFNLQFAARAWETLKALRGQGQA